VDPIATLFFHFHPRHHRPSSSTITRQTQTATLPPPFIQMDDLPMSLIPNATLRTTPQQHTSLSAIGDVGRRFPYYNVPGVEDPNSLLSSVCTYGTIQRSSAPINYAALNPALLHASEYHSPSARVPYYPACLRSNITCAAPQYGTRNQFNGVPRPSPSFIKPIPPVTTFSITPVSFLTCVHLRPNTITTPSCRPLQRCLTRQRRLRLQILVARDFLLPSNK
jgi:hypothetical protein